VNSERISSWTVGIITLLGTTPWDASVRQARCPG
jgi:hypothetical protein